MSRISQINSISGIFFFLSRPLLRSFDKLFSFYKWAAISSLDQLNLKNCMNIYYMWWYESLNIIWSSIQTSCAVESHDFQQILFCHGVHKNHHSTVICFIIILQIIHVFILDQFSYSCIWLIHFSFNNFQSFHVSVQNKFYPIHPN